MRFGIIATALFASTASFALPAPDHPYRDGANHHVGDDSFVAKHGRLPRTTDTEKDRMRVHLEHVRELLASQPATRPELAKRRAELLGYLDDYIAKGITPENERLPWRTPVFIDEHGAICAVGYLIERSVGRALPEKIAATHRYEFLEEIAAAMPEVSAWVASSGFTLDELASIQPAYTEPDADTWRTWNLAKLKPEDGVYESAASYTEHKVAGTFKRRRMEGLWKATKGDVVVGWGDFKRGSGTWQSYYPDGKQLLAEGPYVNNVAHGAWKFFHTSGRLAAEGRFVGGTRTGAWSFYYDAPTKTPIAKGSFSTGGHVVGRWKHFDEGGKLLARTWTETPAQWGDRDFRTDGGEGHMLDIVAGADGIRHQIHQGQVQIQPGDLTQGHLVLELLTMGNDRVYVYHQPFTGYDGESSSQIIYDAGGNKLERTDAGWQAADCGWATKRETIAKSGDVARLHGLLYKDARKRSIVYEKYENISGGYHKIREGGDPGPKCGTAKPIAATRAAKLEKMLAFRDVERVKTPDFVRKLVLGETTIDDADPTNDPDADEWKIARWKTVTDLTRVIKAHMAAYLEWPHIDRRFIDVFETMPGRRRCFWHSPCDPKDPD